MIRSYSLFLLTASTMAATVMQTIDTTIANVALPHMRGSLSASQEQIGWVLTSYIVASAIATVPVGFLSRRFGSKRLFLICVVGFTGISVLCGMATSLPQMVVFRTLQGLCGAALVPLSQISMLNAYPPERHGFAMAVWGMGVTVGPIFGPLLGGWLTETYSWHWVFFVNVPIGVFAFLGLSATLEESRDRVAPKLDLLGFLFLAIAIFSLQLMLDRGQAKDWFASTEIQLELGAALLFFYLFLVHSFTTREPFIPMALFRDRNFSAGLVLIGLLGLVLFGTFAVLPTFLQTFQNYPVLTAGLVMAPRGLGTMAGMFLVARLPHTMDRRLPMAAGLMLLAMALYWMSRFSADVPPAIVAWSGVLQGLGMGMFFAPLSVLTLSTLSPRLRNDGAALFNLMRNIGSSMGIALVFAALNQGTGIAREALVGEINLFDHAIWGLANSNSGLTGLAPLGILESEIQRQSGVIASLGVFHYMMLAVIFCSPALLLLRSPEKTKALQAAE